MPQHITTILVYGKKILGNIFVFFGALDDHKIISMNFKIIDLPARSLQLLKFHEKISPTFISTNF